MGAKRIKKTRNTLGLPEPTLRLPDTEENRRAIVLHFALRAIAENNLSIHMPSEAAPVPTWALNGPVPSLDKPNRPIPAIRPEFVDGVFIITDPHIVDDFEKHRPIARLLEPLEESVLLWLIDKSRLLEHRDMDTEHSIEFGPAIKGRRLGSTLAELAENGFVRVVATHDRGKLILQPANLPPMEERIAFVKAHHQEPTTQ